MRLNHLLANNSDFSVAIEAFGDRAISSKTLLSDIRKMRSQLSLRSEQRWLLTYEQPYLFAIGLFSLLSLNKTVVLTANRKACWLAEIEQSFDCLLVDGVEPIPSDKYQLVFNEAQLTTEVEANQATISFSGNEQIIFFTSGSTGRPKQVEKKLSYLTNEAEVLETTFGEFLGQRKIASSVSHFHIYGLLFNLIWPLQSGRAWCTEIIEYQEQLGQIEKAHSVALVSSPAFLSRLDQNLKLHNRWPVFSSGGPLSMNAATNTQSLFGERPFEVYGSTETGGIGFRQQRQENQPWQAFSGVTFEQKDNQTWVKSGHIGPQTQLKLDDQLSLLEHNQFILSGRADRIVKVEEKRVSLTEIEAFISELAWIKESACVVIEGQRIIIGAVVVLTEQGEQDLTQLGRLKFFQNIKAVMRNRFENVTIPRKWRVVAEIPLNQQSKREYSELKALFEGTN